MELATQIDKSILRFTTESWQKVAMVAANVMFETDPDMSEVNDFEVAKRVKALVAGGQIQSQGNLDDMRRSEIRLAEPT